MNAKNILLKLEYAGGNYFGFQIQRKGQATIQGVLEKALAKLFREKIRVAASGRTDRGVHARAQVVNFKVTTKIPLPNIKAALNTFLPQDIRIRKVKLVPDSFHARFSVKSKVYRYTILNKKEFSVFWHNLTWQIKDNLDIKLMRKASGKIKGRRDFSVFAKEVKKYKDCVRDIKDISIKKRGGFIQIDIEANGFLRWMVRNIVSFLVRIASKNLPLREIPLILAKKTSYTNKPAPASGLCLHKVIY